MPQSLFKRTRQDSDTDLTNYIASDLSAGTAPANSVNVAVDLWAGKRIVDIERDRGLGRRFIRCVGTAIGWDSTWVVGPKRGRRSTGLIGTMTVADMLTRFDAGESLKAIGDDAGVTRERVRQVALVQGRSPRHQEAARRKAVRTVQLAQEKEQRAAERAAARAKRHEERIKHWATASLMWASGKTVQQIADAYKVTVNNMGWYMSQCRKRYGMFPLREPERSEPRPHGMCGRLTEDAVAARVASGEAPLSVMGEAGVSAWRLRRACRVKGVAWPSAYNLDGVPRSRHV